MTDERKPLPLGLRGEPLLHSLSRRGLPKVNSWARLSQLPATSKESDALSADLKKRGFKFVGSTIVYAHMQATGLVNDHLTTCFRRKACKAARR